MSNTVGASQNKDFQTGALTKLVNQTVDVTKHTWGQNEKCGDRHSEVK